MLDPPLAYSHCLFTVTVVILVIQRTRSWLIVFVLQRFNSFSSGIATNLHDKNMLCGLFDPFIVISVTCAESFQTTESF